MARILMSSMSAVQPLGGVLIGAPDAMVVPAACAARLRGPRLCPEWPAG